MRILIAEDDLTSRIVLETLLKKWGHDVVSASDGDEAWLIMEADDAPSLAILDWMMPGIEGVEICRRIREMERPVQPHIILLTALGRKEDIVVGLEAGADDYVTKPFSNEELLARIDVAERIITLQEKLRERVIELEAALEDVKTLQGILPICMYCHKIRTDQESWERIENYIQEHSDAEFSHGLCPECLEEHYPKYSPETEDDNELVDDGGVRDKELESLRTYMEK